MEEDEKKFNQAMKFLTPKANKIGEDVISAIADLDLGEEEKDAILTWMLELILFRTPYPNRIIVSTLANIIQHISEERALGFLDWKERNRILRKIGTE